jgi:hypothetical protein
MIMIRVIVRLIVTIMVRVTVRIIVRVMVTDYKLLPRHGIHLLLSHAPPDLKGL